MDSSGMAQAHDVRSKLRFSVGLRLTGGMACRSFEGPVEGLAARAGNAVAPSLRIEETGQPFAFTDPALSRLAYAG